MTRAELCRLEQAELVKLIEEGRLVYLPCKVGDTVWKIKSVFSYFTKPMEDRIDLIKIFRSETIVTCTSGVKFNIDKIGKIVFLTPEEAEQKLKELAK